MSTCEAYRKMMSDFIEGNLQEPDRIRLEEHIRACGKCRHDYERVKKLSLVLEDSFKPSRSESAAVDLILESIALQPMPQANSGLFLRVAAGVLVAAGLALSFYAGRVSDNWRANRLTQTAYTVRDLKGIVLVKHSNSDVWMPLTATATVYADDQFLSAAGGSVVFGIGERSSITLQTGSTVVLNITPEETNLHLAYGTLDLDLSSPHGPFYVTTPHGRAEALGTEFTVKVD